MTCIANPNVLLICAVDLPLMVLIVPALFLLGWWVGTWR